MKEYDGIIVKHFHWRTTDEEEIIHQAETNGLGAFHYGTAIVAIHKSYAKDALIPYHEMQRLKQDNPDREFLNMGKLEAQRVTGSLSAELKVMVQTQSHLGALACATVDCVSDDPKDWFSLDGSHREKDFVILEGKDWIEATIHLFYIKGQQNGPMLIRGLSRNKRHAVSDKISQQFIDGDSVLKRITQLWPERDEKTGEYIIFRTTENKIYSVNARLILGAIYMRKYKDTGNFNPEKASGQMTPLDVTDFYSFLQEFEQAWTHHFPKGHPNKKIVMRSVLLLGICYSWYDLEKNDEGKTARAIRNSIRNLVYKLGLGARNFVTDYHKIHRFSDIKARHFFLDFCKMMTVADNQLDQQNSIAWDTRANELCTRLKEKCVRAEQRPDRMAQRIQTVLDRPVDDFFQIEIESEVE